MAENVAVITDSSACIPKELAQKYSIELVPEIGELSNVVSLV